MNHKTIKFSYYIYIFSYVILAAIFIVGLIAPFTFLKPQSSIREPNTDVKMVVIEKPLHDVYLPKFSEIKDVKEKKRRFFSFIRPTLEKQNKKILLERARLVAIKEHYFIEPTLTITDKTFIEKMNKKYKSKTKFGVLAEIDLLLVKVDIVPIPLVLVQAANESAWGTSRFARIGLNFFGMWCFEKGCGMVPRKRNDGAMHEVAAFDSVEEAVTKYLYNINTNTAYKVFRAIRGQLRLQKLPLTSEILVTGLLPYSERGTDYVLEISDMIRHNKPYF